MLEHGGSTWTVSQSFKGEVGGIVRFARARDAESEWNHRIAALITEHAGARTFNSVEARTLLGLSRQTMENIRDKLGVGKREVWEYVYTKGDMARMFRRPLIQSTRLTESPDLIRKAFQNLYLRSSLTPRQRQVIELRYALDGGKPQSLAAVGARLGIKRQAIHQIERVALAKLLDT